MSTDNLPEEYRREVFAALVAVQDEGVTVASSREVISERFGLSVSQVKKVEDQGLKLKWPPL